MITCPGIITYPVLFSPKDSPSGALKFSCTLLVPKTDKEGIAKLKAEIANAVAKGKDKVWNGKVPPFQYQPLRDGDAELESGVKSTPEYKGHMFLNCSSNADSPPGVVDKRAQPLMDQQAIYSGCLVRLDIRAFAYKKSGNSGIGWWLNNVMLLDDGPRLDGKMNAVDAFASFAVVADENQDAIEEAASSLV